MSVRRNLTGRDLPMDAVYPTREIFNMSEKPKYLGSDSEVVGDENRKACYAAWTIHRDYEESQGEFASVGDFRAGFLYGADETARLRATITRQAEALKAAEGIAIEAIEEIADWGAYASDYFQEKHDLAGTIKRLNNKLAAIADDDLSAKIESATKSWADTDTDEFTREMRDADGEAG